MGGAKDRRMGGGLLAARRLEECHIQEVKAAKDSANVIACPPTPPISPLTLSLSLSLVILTVVYLATSLL